MGKQCDFIAVLKVFRIFFGEFKSFFEERKGEKLFGYFLRKLWDFFKEKRYVLMQVLGYEIDKKCHSFF